MNSKDGDMKLKKEKEQRKETIELITQFIQDTFATYSFERMVKMNEECGFKEDEYGKFIEHNKKCLEKLSKKDLSFVVDLVTKIQNEELMQCDEEYFLEWDTFTIYFNKDGKLVMMHPR